MEHDHLTFPEAVEELATRLGWRCRTRAAPTAAARRADEPLYELMATRRALLRARPSRASRAPASISRSAASTPETIAHFGIGYAREFLERGAAALRRQRRRAPAPRRRRPHHRARRAAQLRDGERHYDRFRDRIMFPIRDARGRVIAFGGRIIDQGEPKYLNSPETVLFHKGRELYGLYETRQRASPTLKRLLVVEGYMDVVRLHQAGIDYAVATLGTATTRRASEAHLPPRERGGVRLRRRPRRPRGRLARAAERAARGARGPRDPLPVSARGTRSGHAGGRGGARGLREAPAAAPCRCRSIWCARSARAERSVARRRPRALCGSRAPAVREASRTACTASWCSSGSRRPSGFPPQRLQELWSQAGRQPRGARRRRAARQPAPAAVQRGRGSLVRQAIVRLLQFPAIAARRERAQERAGLDAADEPGIELLRELHR